jgi:3-dehydrosphinganine reductase
VLAVLADLRDPLAIAALAERVEAELGGLDLVVNNAGVARPGRAEELEDAVYVDAIETNYLGAVRLTQAFLPGMLSRGRGHVAFVSSLAGVLGVFGYTAYGASKFALTGYAEALRQELVPRGLGVTIIFPPDTDTPQLAAEAPYKPPETRALAGDSAPLSPQRVAAALVDAIAAGRFHAYADLNSRLLLVAQRLAPGLVRRLMDRTVASARRRE